MSIHFDQIWQAGLDRLEADCRRRSLKNSAESLIDFASNDTFDLTKNPLLIKYCQDFAESWGTGSGASRLVTGNLPPHEMIETKIAIGKKSEASLIFASGFQANSTILPALLNPKNYQEKPLIFADRLIHASLIHGCLASRARMIRFRHNDLNHLEKLLSSHCDDPSPKFIVTETVFSMDGDLADLPSLLSLSQKFGAFLYLDEAHATGIFGDEGMGLATGYARSNCLVMGTFSKAMGSFGAYAACSSVLRDYLINFCGGFIYATSLPPPVLGAILAAIEFLPDLKEERRRVLALAEKFRQNLRSAGLDCGLSASHIVPLILGDEERTMTIARQLEQKGFLSIAIRPPTVPLGTSRLRFSFASRHDENIVEALTISLLDILRREIPPAPLFQRGRKKTESPICKRGVERILLPQAHQS